MSLWFLLRGRVASARRCSTRMAPPSCQWFRASYRLLRSTPGWDDDLLRSERSAWQHEDFNLDMIFDYRDLSRLPADQDAAGQADAIPDVPAIPVTVPGDVWLLGPHRVPCGDATPGETVARCQASASRD